jgi:hypothetical protein
MCEEMKNTIAPFTSAIVSVIHDKSFRDLNYFAIGVALATSLLY